MRKILSSLIPQVKAGGNDTIQSLGTVDAFVLVTGGYTKFTTGSKPVNLNISNPVDTTITQRLTVSITQGATARAVTLIGASVISSGGLVAYGTVLPNSGPNKTDRFTFEWDGVTWECVDLRFDVR